LCTSAERDQFGKCTKVQIDNVQRCLSGIETALRERALSPRGVVGCCVVGKNAYFRFHGVELKRDEIGLFTRYEKSAHGGRWLQVE
jgi:hypothetical protein